MQVVVKTEMQALGRSVESLTERLPRDENEAGPRCH